jgi:hypothetical protein
VSAPAAVVTIREPDLSEAVLERVAGALAARVDLPVDRLLDAQIVLEAVAAGAARHLRGGALTVRFGASPGAISMQVGPLSDGAAERLLAAGSVEGVGPVVERIVDGWSVERDGDGEHLFLSICSPDGARAA